MGIIARNSDNLIDLLEVNLAAGYPLVDSPLTHDFTPNMYIRSILMGEGTMHTSRCHNTCHPFNVSQGKLSVSINGSQWEYIEAPYNGITQKGTRRILYIWEECVFTTYHFVPYITGEEQYFTKEEKEKLAAKIMEEILEDYENKLLGGKLIGNVIHYKKNELENAGR